MWRNPGTPVAIHPSQLVPGLYVWLNVRWDEHPFISNRFLLKNPKDAAVIQSLGIDDRVLYFPGKSSVVPPEYVPPPPTSRPLSRPDLQPDLKPSFAPPSVGTNAP